MADPRPPILDRVHDVLVLLLVALRPWCWDGMPGQAADLVWQALAVGALGIAALERAAGLRPSWAWSWRGALAVALVLALLPAALAAAEPAPSWCRWTSWLACLAAAAYLMQVIAGRQRLALAALGAGFAVTIAFGLAQPLWVLPAMAAAQQAGSPAFAAMSGDGGAISERIANGGIFSTFTLANQFGAYLALLLPVLAGTVWATWRAGKRWPAAGFALVLLGLLALVLTGAKGAILALAAGCGLGWWLAFPGRWWRWLPLPLAGLGLAAVLASGVASGSIAVRAGYWRAAVVLAGEGGHGLGGFAAHQQRIMQPGDEPTRFVHNEVLEAAVSGGWLLGGLAAVALLALAWPRRAAVEPAPQPAPPRLLALALGCAVPYLALLGAFDGQIPWWPGGGGLAGNLAWALLLGALASAAAALLWRAEPPPAWAWAAGLCAVALKALIDFDFHSGGVLGTALIVAVCSGAPLRQASGVAGRWLPMVTAALAAALAVGGMLTALRLAEAEDWISSARQARDPQVGGMLALRLGIDGQAPPQALAALAAGRAWELAVGAPGTRLAALDLMPPGPQTLDLATELAAAAPHSAAIALRRAQLLVAGKARREAVEEAERAVALAPTAPRVLEMAAEVLDRAARESRAAALRAEAERLRPLVHPGMRGR